MIADPRQLRGKDIAERCRIDRHGDRWLVPSQSGGKPYTVSPDPDAGCRHCTCPDYELRGMKCKHIYAVEFTLTRVQHADGSVSETRTLTVSETVTTPRPTYPQNWPAYVRAQTTEKRRFQALLADLCAGVPEPPPGPKGGRPPVPLADQTFTAAFKVYSTVSGRRFGCDLEAAHHAGFLSRPIHPHKISAFMENEALTPILRTLVAESARPLATVETAFAADSSAFSSHKFIRWFDVKHNRVKSEHVWVKVQMMCGVKTNVVTTATVCEQDGPDSPYLPQLTTDTAERFRVGEVLADKGYSSTYGHEAVANAGGTPFIAFKRNATGGAGGVYQKMFHYFQYRRDDFLNHYHQRSNAESVFSAVKRKFGDSLRSKSRQAMVNEVLCKFLCHNVCCLIQEQEELGIAPQFWPAEPAGPKCLTQNLPA